MVVESALKRLIQSEVHQDELKVIVELSHQIASRYLLIKMHQGLLSFISMHNSHEDIAWDCISALFELNQDGQPQKLIHSINEVLNSKPAPPAREEILIALRKVVTNVVNDEIFLIYKESDPSLSRMIRNLKSATNDLEFSSVIKKGNQKLIRFDVNYDDSKLMQISPEILCIRLSSRLNGASAISASTVLQETCNIVTQSESYRAEIPITILATVWRQVLAHHDINTDAEFPDPQLSTNEIQSYVDMAITKLDGVYYDKYVITGKVSSKTWQLYLKCLRDILNGQFTLEVDAKSSYFDYLNVYIPELTLSVYHSDHKSFIEYLARKSREFFISLIRKEFISAS